MKRNFSWQLNKSLLFAILKDRLSDRFVCELVWERLYYFKKENSNIWISSSDTPVYWSQKFFKAPLIISDRTASIHLTRSINKAHKQGLKECLDFKGYKINDLLPRKTRRATAVNWLIFWARTNRYIINAEGLMPQLSDAPIDPLLGHPNDPPIT